MKLFLNGKKIPILKLIIALLIGIFSLVLTRVSFIYIPSTLLLATTVACFSYVTYYAGLFTLIPSIVVLSAILITENHTSVLSALEFLPLALISGFVLRNSKRPVNVIVSLSAGFILYDAVIFATDMFASGIGLTFNGIIQTLTSGIESNATEMVNAVTELTGYQLLGVDTMITFMKALAIGNYVSMTVIKACVVYIAIAASFKISKCERDITDSSMLNVKVTRITAVIYIICLLLTIFSTVSPDKVKYYSMLSQNILLILTPILLFSGVYYVFKIKFKVEHSSPLMLIISIVVALFGAYPILIFYLSLSGVTYSFKYNNLKNRGFKI